MVLAHSDAPAYSRDNAVQRDIQHMPNISQRMLSVALKSLEADKLVSRKAYPEIPPRVEYALTPLGRSLIPPLEGVIRWAISNADEILEHRNKSGRK